MCTLSICFGGLQCVVWCCCMVALAASMCTALIHLPHWGLTCGLCVASIHACSRYGVAKGTVLTAWRLMRCNPWGGRGYDPPAWPPVGLARLFVLDGSAEVACVVGVSAVAWLVQATLHDLFA